MSTVTVELDAIETTTARALQAHGAAPWVAACVAHAVRVAEARDNRICGLFYLPSYCKQLLSGRVHGDVEPEVRRPKPASVVVDAKLGFAQAAFARGLATGVQAARDNGVATLAICHAHTCTALGYFTEQIAHAGLIGIGVTNGWACVSPPGGSEAVLGTNPVAMSVPDGAGGVAMQFDQSTSAIALGKIHLAAAAGEKIPLGWGVDHAGCATRDPTAVLNGGSLASAGGYKGYGFGLMAEILAAAFTGGNTSTQVEPLKATEGSPHNLGQCYILIDPTNVAGDVFWRKLRDISAVIARQPGARLPGSQRRLPKLVELDTEVWATTRALAAR